MAILKVLSVLLALSLSLAHSHRLMMDQPTDDHWAAEAPDQLGAMKMNTDGVGIGYGSGSGGGYGYGVGYGSGGESGGGCGGSGNGHDCGHECGHDCGHGCGHGSDRPCIDDTPCHDRPCIDIPEIPPIPKIPEIPPFPEIPPLPKIPEIPPIPNIPVPKFPPSGCTDEPCHGDCYSGCSSCCNDSGNYGTAMELSALAPGVAA